MHFLQHISVRRLILSALIGAMALFFVVSAAQAQNVVNPDLRKDILQETADTVGGRLEGNQLDVDDPRQVIFNVVNRLLVLLGIGFILYAIYGGYLYATARGDGEQVKKAIGVFRRAIVGVIIMLLSYGIATFVSSALVQPKDLFGSREIEIGGASTGVSPSDADEWLSENTNPFK